MPEQETIERCREDEREGKSPSTQLLGGIGSAIAVAILALIPSRG